MTTNVEVEELLSRLSAETPDVVARELSMYLRKLDPADYPDAVVDRWLDALATCPGVTLRELESALRAVKPEAWIRPAIDAYLGALLAAYGARARVPSQRDARLLNAVGGEVGPGFAACEECRAVFRFERSRWRLSAWLCDVCSLESRNRLNPARRRSSYAWWSCIDKNGEEIITVEKIQVFPVKDGKPLLLGRDCELCVGCSVPDGTRRPNHVSVGALYCSDACRKRVSRYLKRGGWIRTSRAGQPVTLGAPSDKSYFDSRKR